MHYPRGKSLGGSSARNYMIYHRPTEGSLQMWADKVGDASYEFANFLPYFEKSITFTPGSTTLRLANATTTYSTTTLEHGTGPLHLTFANWVYAFPTWAAKALTATLGIPLRAEGLQDGGLLGHAYTMYTVDPATQLRSSSETAFLRPSLDAGDPDYYVYPLTLARRVLFDDDRRATGVLVQTATANYTLSARKEVVLAAGVIGSPQLLQVSGVGPADLVAALGVPLVADRPGVGQNFQDQILFGVTHAVDALTASAYSSQPGYAAAQADLFNSAAAGPLTSVGADMTAWEKLPPADRNGSLSPATQAALAAYPPDWPELEYIVFSGYGGNGSTFTASDPGDGRQYATMTVVLTAPLSRGNVTATSPDAAVPPAIDPAYLTAAGDIEVAVAGFKRARRFWASDALDGFVVGGGGVDDEAYPGAQVVSDEEIASAIRGGFQTIYHGSCTCAMGPEDDDMAVVDAQARVYGVQGLRVVDASAFPLLPPGHPQSTVCEYLSLVPRLVKTCSPVANLQYLNL